MRPEPGALKDEFVDVDPDRHLYFRSAFIMNHAMGEWRSGGPQRQLRRLVPKHAVRQGVVADRSIVGVHIRRGDNVLSRSRSPTAAFQRRMDALLRETPEVSR